MHDSLDSRALRFTDCFGQRFTEPGTYAYHALPVGSTLLDDERPFTVVVKARSGDRDTDANQSTVLLPWNGRRFVPDDPEVAIESGDLVMWHSPTNGAPPFAIVGNGFGSSPLAGESVYTHAFGSPGTYEWVDTQGSDLAGVVRVTDPRCRDDAELARWRKRLNGGTVVVIDGGKAEPAEAEVSVGQTVFFAVAGGSRVTVTDRHLAAVEVGCYPGGDGPVSDDGPAARPNRKARRTAGKASKAAKAAKATKAAKSRGR